MIGHSPVPTPDRLVVSDVEVTHNSGRPNELRLLGGISFDVTAGQASASSQPISSIAITGPSGSGKSTLLYVAAGLQTPSSGSVKMYEEGSPVKRSRMFGSSAPVAFIQQDPARGLPSGDTPLQLIEKTILRSGDNAGLDLGSDLSRVDQAELLLGMVGLDSTKYTSEIGNFSGGQMQMVAIARALATGQNLVFADEPTGAIDPSGSGMIEGLLTDAMKTAGRCAIIVTHDQQFAEICDQQITFNEQSGQFDVPEALLPKRSEHKELSGV